jgi:hypothetical protein
MRTTSFRAKVLQILGSASIAGISVPLACGGQSLEAPPQGDAGDTGQGGAGGRSGETGGSSGTFGGTGGSSLQSGGTGSGTTGSGATGGTVSGSSGEGGTQLGAGGIGAVAGWGQAGGLPGVAGSGSGGLPSNCFSSGVGTCCGSTKCLSPEAAWALSGEAGAPGAGGEGGNGADGCPAGELLPSGLCYWYSDLTRETPEECCYAYSSGDCCGRPFVVAGDARRAPASRRSDWQLAGVNECAGLDPATRRALGHEWLEDGRLEHASIASFARFVLQLLSLGAPAVLVELAQSAVADEIRHARLCFELASRYFGDDVGPGPLDIGGGGETTTIVDATVEAVVAGCVGETLAALQAETQLELATDPAVRKTLEIIARDEARHAELAWHFVKWAIDQHGAPVIAAAHRAFAQAERRLHSERATELGAVDAAAFHGHGRLAPAERLAAHRRAFREVIAPCRDALLGVRCAGRATDTQP